MDIIGIVDFGGQYTHLIANRIRRLGVFSEIVLPDTPIDKLVRFSGIILSGGPNSVMEPGSPRIDPLLFTLKKPILGLCYGHHLMALLLGGSVQKGAHREYGMAFMECDTTSSLFRGLEQRQRIWMSHGDSVENLPAGFKITASTTDCRFAAVANEAERFFGFQFHPEVTDTPGGMTMLENFLNVCGCKKEWTPASFTKEIMEEVRKQCGNRKVFLLVSGGVDSTVAFTLLNRALGPERVLGLHIDTGLMRAQESTDVMAFMRDNGYNNLQIYDATSDFTTALANKSDPEEKRRIIGTTFIEVSQKVQNSLGLNRQEWLLAQGTIYPDTIESAGSRHADRIKTHHNRVDIILELIEQGLVVEPLAHLYKDEVRLLGKELGISHDLLWRHPFPGPGLGVRLLCSKGIVEQGYDAEKGKIDAILSGSAYSATILPIRSVGVQGDSRSYSHPVLLTGPIEWERLEVLSTKITNSIRSINRVLVQISQTETQKYTLRESYCTKDRLDKLRQLDYIVTRIVRESGEYEKIWQMPVVLLPLVNSSNEECAVLRPITSQEAMTARFYPLALNILLKIAEASLSVPGIGDIFFDITHKPPGTIEWE